MTREEAIRRIRAWHLEQDDLEVLAEVIPELRESEDEITRKRIINLIRELASATVPIMTGGYFIDGQDKRYIAYLEKQKEQKPASISCGHENDTEWSEEDERMLDKVCCLISPGTILNAGDADYCLELKQWIVSLQERILKLSCTQPKQEWSEEGEHRITDAIYFLESAKIHYADTSEIEKTIAWLKSLRPSKK